LADQIKKNEMGAGSSTHGGRTKVHIGLRWENLKERDHLEESGIDRKDDIKIYLHELG
jgi:hypothetical protein